jgi:hypothetical protein
MPHPTKKVSTTSAIMTTLTFLNGQPADASYVYHCEERKKLDDKLEGNQNSIAQTIKPVNIGLDMLKVGLDSQLTQIFATQAEMERKAYAEGENRLSVETRTNQLEADISCRFFHASRKATDPTERAFARAGAIIHLGKSIMHNFGMELAPEADPIVYSRYHKAGPK